MLCVSALVLRSKRPDGFFSLGKPHPANTDSQREQLRTLFPSSGLWICRGAVTTNMMHLHQALKKRDKLPRSFQGNQKISLKVFRDGIVIGNIPLEISIFLCLRFDASR